MEDTPKYLALTTVLIIVVAYILFGGDLIKL